MVITPPWLSSRRKPGSSAEVDRASAEEEMHELDPGLRRGDGSGRRLGEVGRYGCHVGPMVVIPANAGIQDCRWHGKGEKVTHELDPGVRRGDGVTG